MTSADRTPAPTAAGTASDTTVVVGRIGRPHGVRGQVTIESRTDEPEARFGAGAVLITEPADIGPLTVTDAKFHSGRWVLSFEGYDDRFEAEELRGTILVVPLADLPDLDDPDEFRDHELIGLAAIGPDEELLGTVTDVNHGPGGDVLVVTDDKGPHLVPFVKAIVTSVDPAAGHVRMDPPSGLFDL